MKKLKISTTIILLAVLAFGFQGCKKGENDPFISFKSRDARLAGDWTLSGSESESISTTVSGGQTVVNTTTTSYSGGVATTKSGNNPATTSKYNLKMKIEKNGQITVTMENFDSKGAATGTSEQKGLWTWGSTSKKKSCIHIDIDAPLSAMIGGVWMIDQLKNKEIIFKKVDFKKSSTGSNSTENKDELTMTFTGK